MGGHLADFLQCWFYLRLAEHHDLNYYAYPLDLCAEVSEDLQVTKIYRLPTSSSERINNEPPTKPSNHNKALSGSSARRSVIQR
jgi:hypothetical protein